MKNVSVSLVAMDEDAENRIVGVLFGLTDFCYWLYVTDPGVDRAYEHNGIVKTLMRPPLRLPVVKKTLPFI